MTREAKTHVLEGTNSKNDLLFRCGRTGKQRLMHLWVGCGLLAADPSKLAEVTCKACVDRTQRLQKGDVK